jgi:AcrR family transcriptional regulator
VLRAAREVFGELGYDAPMEEVARRAGVGIGTVYRRFPSREVLVARIAAEETAWLTQQTREALAARTPDPWDSLVVVVTRAVESGAGRLLPPQAFRRAEELVREGLTACTPQDPWFDESLDRSCPPFDLVSERALLRGHAVREGLLPPLPDLPSREGGAGEKGTAPFEDPSEFLTLLGTLVDRCHQSRVLGPDITLLDVLLVLTGALPPTTPDRLRTRHLDLSLRGLRAAQPGTG